jgi:hypothetical protein
MHETGALLWEVRSKAAATDKAAGSAVETVQLRSSKPLRPTYLAAR